MIVLQVFDLDEDVRLFALKYTDTSIFRARTSLWVQQKYPLVKLKNDRYIKPRWPPQLQWQSVYKGHNLSGEILSASELIQVIVDRWSALCDIESHSSRQTCTTTRLFRNKS